jgi:hypothetical protein
MLDLSMVFWDCLPEGQSMSVGSFDIEKIHLNGDSGWISGWITWLVGGG